MHEDNGSPTTEGEIGASRKVLAMEAIAVAELRDHASHDHLGFAVFTANSAHVRRALESIQLVHDFMTANSGAKLRRDLNSGKVIAS